MLRRLGIRWKILAILAVPIAVLTAGALFISLTAVSDSRSTRQVSNLIYAAEDMRSVVEALQQERHSALRFINADDSDRESLVNELEQSRWLTDEALAGLRGHLDIIDFDLLDDRILELIDETVETHARLEALRPRVESGSITESTAFDSYSKIIRNDVMLASRLGGLIEQRDPAEFISTYATLDLLTEYLKQERELGETVINTTERTDQVRADLQSLVALQEELLDNAASQLDALDTEATVPSIATNVATLRILVQTGSVETLERMDVNDWIDSINRVIDNIEPARGEVIEIAAQRADEAATDARNQAIITIGGATIAVLFSLFLALIVARGIVNPLRRLTRAAEKVRDDLPRLVEQVATPGAAPDIELERIPVESRDEIGKLASAFNSVNETTVTVAQEQAALRGSIAEMFVNVARRDQVLLNRQLTFITQLERTEEDPAQLEDLFRLDHLATRMRRNAESLLVLAGIDSGRRLRNPMAISDVVRTASSEIEHYDRIDLVLMADPAVLGHVALTVAHLLAELMENATVFSDPTSRVEVMTALREDGVAISITDDGLGMDAAAVADVNEKIRSSSASDVIGAQRLGMFVVGHLSSRLGIQVEVSSPGEGRGTRVDVLVPLDLLDQSTLELASDAQQPEPSSLATTDYESSSVGLPVRGATGLPMRQSALSQSAETPASAEQPAPVAEAAPVGEGEAPPEVVERAGLFTGFRSVSANSLESLEAFDPTTLDTSQQEAYVPLVSEERDDLGGLSRSGKPVSPPAFEPEIVYTAEPMPERNVGQPAENADAEPQTEVRVYTGAFPTATGEYPTYTGEIPLHTGEVPSYPSRRSRRELRQQEADPVVTGDHHVEFEPIEFEDDAPARPESDFEQADAIQGEFAPGLAPKTTEAQAPVDASDTQDRGNLFPTQPPPDDSDLTPNSDFVANAVGFPAVPTAEAGIVQQQSEASFSDSVLADAPKEEKPKRKGFRLFGRKPKAEAEEIPVRESRFPGPMVFTPDATNVAAPVADWNPQPSSPQPSESQPSESQAREFHQELEASAHQPPSELESQPDPVAEPHPEPEPKPTPEPTPEPAVPEPQHAFTPQTSWAPNSGNGHGALGAEAADELRRRSAITSEVLSELSQLSMYQPEAQHAAPASSLQKRVPSEVPIQPESNVPAQSSRRRDASQVRSMLSGFQAGVSRAQSADTTDSVQDGEER